MKKGLLLVISLLILLISPSGTNAASVYWDGVELKKGQTGRIIVIKPINLWQRTETGLQFVRVLKPGERYRVYRQDQIYGGQYGLGASLYVTNMKGYIKYETPSSDKWMLVNRENKYFVDQIVITPAEDYNQEAVKGIKQRIGNLPKPLLLQLWKNPITIQLTNGPITETEELAYLKGVIPRGWEGTHLTWDDVPGIGGMQTIVIRIGYSEQGKGHNSVNLELHELAHSIDQILKGQASSLDPFLSIWKKERENLFPDNTYFTHYSEEYYAETFAMYFYSETTRNHLRVVAPKTYQYMQKQFPF
jgi:Pro-Pro endopeptidase